MEQSTAQRRLVKSPPELWAEVSSEDILGRHLAEFGEIRITRADPETTVAWEGDRVSGTVELTPEGWGTKVVLTATPALAPPAQAPEPVAAEPEPEPEPEPAPAPPPVVFRATPVRLAPPEREPEARRGFFARLFGRQAEPAAEIPTPGPPPADPSPPTPTPDPMPPAPGPEPTPPPSPTPPIDPIPPGGPDPGPTPPSIELDPTRTVAILTDVLDDLGAAHHRPFSRG
jgi:hypothetical protein